MENMMGEIIVAFVLGYMLFIIVFVFSITTIMYFTYRFWKMILPKEELHVFVNNAPVIGHNYNMEEEKDDFSNEKL